MSDTKTVLDRAKDNAPGLVLGAAALAVAIASSGGAPTLDAPSIPPRPPSSEGPREQRWWSPVAREGQTTRLVSCGRGGKVDGDDASGMIHVGVGAGGRCTLLFASHWPTIPTCIIDGGKAVSGNATDLVLEVTGAQVGYRCGVAK